MKIVKFGEINIDDPFFDSFKENYPEFKDWWKRKKDDLVFIDTTEDGQIVSFLKLKIEYTETHYPYKTEVEKTEKVLKICSFKGMKYFCDIMLRYIENFASSEKVDVIYGTIFVSQETIKLFELLKENGFSVHGVKDSGELIIVKNIKR